MNGIQDNAAAAQAWLARLLVPQPGGVDSIELPILPLPALAALVAEALARRRRLLIATADDSFLPELSNALDLSLRPLCLVLPEADYALPIALRATLSLLNSRLHRHGSDSDGPIWAEQRQRLAVERPLWQASLDWSGRGLDREPWPDGLLQLFPVCVAPLRLCRRLALSGDWAVLVGVAPDRAAEAWPGAASTLWLIEAVGGAPELRSGLPAVADPVAQLRAQLELLTQELSELELELATAQAEIAGFNRRYHDLVGGRMAELDQLQAQLASYRAATMPEDLDARQDAEHARCRAEQSRRESERWRADPRASAGTFSPSRDLKRLYRSLAQKIHPDRARDETDRAWRTQLMSEANRAYREGDEAGLHEIFSLWQEGAGQRQARDTDAERLGAQVDTLKRRIAAIEGELNRLFGSRLYELFTAAGIARRAGRDLLEEMGARLTAQIEQARRQLAEFGA